MPAVSSYYYFFFPFLPIIHLLDALSERSPLIARTVLAAPRSRPSKGDGGTGGENSSGEAHPDSGILLGELGARGRSRVRCGFLERSRCALPPLLLFLHPLCPGSNAGQGMVPPRFCTAPLSPHPASALADANSFYCPLRRAKRGSNWVQNNSGQPELLLLFFWHCGMNNFLLSWPPSPKITIFPAHIPYLIGAQLFSQDPLPPASSRRCCPPRPDSAPPLLIALACLGDLFLQPGVGRQT